MSEQDNNQAGENLSGFPLSALFAVLFSAWAIFDLIWGVMIWGVMIWGVMKPSNWASVGAWLGFAFTCYAKPFRLTARRGLFELIQLPLRKGIRPEVHNTVAAVAIIFCIGVIVLKFGFGM